MSSSEDEFCKLVNVYSRLVEKYSRSTQESTGNGNVSSLSVVDGCPEDIQCFQLTSPFNVPYPAGSNVQRQNLGRSLESVSLVSANEQSKDSSACSKRFASTLCREQGRRLPACSSLHTALSRLTDSLKDQKRLSVALPTSSKNGNSALSLQLASLEYAKLLATLNSVKWNPPTFENKARNSVPNFDKQILDPITGLPGCTNKRKDSGESSTDWQVNYSFPVKRTRLIWTAELHKRFEEAVDKIGPEKAVPKAILEEMNVEGLTRENVASHLQKYRIQQRQSNITKQCNIEDTLLATSKSDAENQEECKATVA